MKNTSYDSIRAAGIAGTLAAIAMSRAHGVEYGGRILREGDRFIVSQLIKGSVEGVSLNAPQDIQDKTAAIFHTHTTDGDDNSETNWFSGTDVRAMLYNRTIAYLGSAITGEVREIDATSAEKFLAGIEKKETDYWSFKGSRGDPMTAYAVLGKMVLTGDHMSA